MVFMHHVQQKPSEEKMDVATPNTLDTGTAYGKKPGSYDRFLTEVGPGTPCGVYAPVLATRRAIIRRDGSAG